MKIIVYVLGALLAVVLGVAAWFYFITVQPLMADKVQLEAATNALESAQKELKKCRDAEQLAQKAGAWTAPLVEAVKAGFGDEIAAGKAEVVSAGNRVIVNFTEDLLYQPGSVTFSGQSVEKLGKIAAFLKTGEIKDREVVVGNTAQSVAAKGKGKKKIPAKDGRALASERSLALVKNLEKNGVNSAMLVSAAYPSDLADRGFKIKGSKTILIIENPVAAPAPAAQKTATVKPNPAQPKPGEQKP